MRHNPTSPVTDLAPLHLFQRAETKAFTVAIVLFTLFFSTTAFAQTEVEISSHLDRDTLNPGDAFTYEVNASVAGHFNIEIAAEPDLGDFTVQGQMTAPSYRVVDGSSHRSLRREYRLRAPHQPGTYTIAAPTFRIGDREFSPEDETIEVVDDGRARATPEDDPGSDRADERAFVEASLNPDRDPYVGEQVTVDYTLYTHHSERRLRPRGPDQPALDGFWVEDISRHVRRQRGRIQRYGDFWYTTPIYAYVLFPLSAGPAEIDPLEISLDRVSTFDRELEMVAESEPIELDIRPLPDGAPDGFSSGNVGHFEFDIHVDTDDVAAGDQMRLNAHIDGTGRVERLGEPTFDVPDDFRLLSTDDSYSQTIEGDRLGGRRTFEYRLMPLEEGTTEIPPLSFTYFDPDEAEYITLHTDPIEFDVASGDIPVLPDPVADDLERTTPEVSDDPLTELHALLPPATIDAGDASARPVASWLIALPLVALVLLVLGPVVARPILHRLSPTFRRRALRRRIDEELRGDDDAPSRCLRALQLCIRDGLDLTVGALTTEDVAAALADTDLPDNLAAQLTDLVDRLVQTRYAPNSSAAEDDALLEETKTLITSLLDYCFEDDEDNSPKTAEKMASIVAIATAALLMGVAASPSTADATPPEDDASEQLAETPEEWAKIAKDWALRAQEEPADPTTHFNAGTASAHAGDLGAARLHLERAYMVAPDDSVVRHNLDLVTGTVASQSDQAAFAAQSPTARTFGTTGPHIVVALLWLTMALAALYRITGRPRSRATFAALTITLLVATTAVAVLWYYVDNFPGDAELAIVTAEQAQLYQAPSSHSESAIDTPLSAGSAILVHHSRDGWLDAELPSGHNGWLKIDAAAPVSAP